MNKTTTSTPLSVDVAILGAGISGTILGAIFARHGFKVLILDAETHPRFAVGESTVGRTSTMLGIIADRYDVPEIRNIASTRGIQEKVTLACGVKRAVSFVYHRPDGRQEPEESNQFVIPPLLHGPENHLFRQDIDAYLMNVAVGYGAMVRQGTRVADVELSADRVTLKDTSGRTVEARYLIDCSGYRSPLATKLGLREEPTRLKHVSRCLFTHMVGVKPYDDCVHPKNVHGMPIPWFQSTLHHVFDGGWIWVIPFNNHKRSTNQLCSVGLTLDPRRFPANGAAPEEEFRKIISSFPSVIDQFRDATSIRPWVSTGRLQYSSSRAAGERYCLVGHAYGFVDALFSRGLAVTMDVINTLAGRVMGALRADDFSMSRFDYVERFSRNLLDSNDQLVNCAFTSFSDYRLLNAWLRIWAIGEAGLDQLRILKASLRFKETRDPSVLEGLDEGPYPGLLCPNHEGYKRLWDDSVADVEAVSAGRLASGEAAERIFQRIREGQFVAPFIGLGDPSRRVVDGSVKTGLGWILWGKTMAPELLRNNFFDLPPKALAKLTASNLKELWVHNL